MDYQPAPVTVTQLPDGYHVALVGPIHTNVSWIEQEFARVLKNKPKLVEFDLSQTPYISSLGVGMLVGFRNQLDAIGSVFKIVKIDARTNQILQYAHLNKVLNVDPAGVIKH